MRFSERLFRRFVYKYYARNLMVDLQLRAKRESIDYIEAHMRDATMFARRLDMLSSGLAMAPADGLVLEFGVAKGESLRHLAGRTQRRLHGFDSFEGLPEDWSGTNERRGKFSTGGKRPDMPANVSLHAGWFDATLPPFLAANPGPVAFMHVDCDIYSSTKTIFDLTADRLQPGTVIVFDEYFNYWNWQQHEHKAFQELVTARGLRYRYFGFGQSGGQVGVVIERVGRRDE